MKTVFQRVLRKPAGAFVCVLAWLLLSSGVAHAEPHAGDWRTIAGSVNGWAYSPLDQIEKANAHRLQAVWTHQAPLTDRLASTPAAQQGIVYLLEPTRVLALDAFTGTALWRTAREAPRGPSGEWGFAQGVAVRSPHLVLSAAEGGVALADARTGETRWSAARELQVAATPLTIENTVIVEMSDGVLRAFDASTGSLKWQAGLGAAAVAGGREGATGVYNSRGARLYWSLPGRAPACETMLALNLADGSTAWSAPLSAAPGEICPAATAAVFVPAAPGSAEFDTLLVAGPDGSFSVFNAEHGSLGRRTLAAEAVRYGPRPCYDPVRKRLFVSAEAGADEVRRFSIRALNATDGRVEWQFDVTSPVSAGLLCTAGGLVFMGTEDADIVALDADTGKVVWNFHPGGPVGGAPISYLSRGRQQIAMPAGGSLVVFGLPE